MEKEIKEAVERLGQLRHLRREAELLNARIRELELAAQGGAMRITGMPRGGASGDRVGDYAAKLADLRLLLRDRRGHCLEELERLYAFIDAIDDSLTRQVFTYRYVDGMTWQRVATAIGEGDEQYPRRLHNRYLRDRARRPGNRLTPISVYVMIRLRRGRHPSQKTARGSCKGDDTHRKKHSCSGRIRKGIYFHLRKACAGSCEKRQGTLAG